MNKILPGSYIIIEAKKYYSVFKYTKSCRESSLFFGIFRHFDLVESLIYINFRKILCAGC